MSGGQILSDIFEPSLSLDGKRNSAERAMSLWEDMARSLDEIAANTRKLYQKTVVAHTGQAEQNQKKRGSLSQQQQSDNTEQREKTSSVHSILASQPPDSKGVQRAPAASPAVPKSTEIKIASLPALPASAKPESKVIAEHTPTIVQATKDNSDGYAATKEQRPATSHDTPTTKTKSQESLARLKSEAADKAQARTIADTLKQNLAKWDGTVVGENGDVKDAAGLAAGGPVYEAIKEVTGAIESKEDDGSLMGALRKTVEDKTGVTTVKEKASAAKEGLKSRIQVWAGGDPTSSNVKKGKRDKQWRFIRPSPTSTEKEQTELSAKSFELAQRDSKESKKRHQELVRAVNSISGGSSNGLFDQVMERKRGRNSRDRTQGRRHRGETQGRGRGRGTSIAGKRGRRLSRVGARLGGIGTKALGFGAGLLGIEGMLSGVGGAEAIASTLATSSRTSVKPVTAMATAAGSSTGLLGSVGKAGASAGKLGVKAAGGVARAIPIAGQVLAAGMALYDGVQGWGDRELHQSAFGLADGEEASTGQKASAAAANVLDMGGLVTGIAGLAGFDIGTDDIASGIYTATSAVSDTVGEAWNSITGLFTSTSDTPEQKTHEQIVPATEAAGAGVTPLLAEKRKEHLQKNDDEPSSKEPLASDEKNVSLFEALTTAVIELGETIKDEIAQKELEGSGLFASVRGLFSGVTSWVGTTVSGSGNRGERKAKPASSSSAPYVHDPNSKVGETIAKYESGSAGSQAIGYDRTGGTSYGKYQIASRVGSMENFLTMLESKGGDHAAMAARLRTAGPSNTGSKHGAMPEQWKREAASNGELLQAAEREYIIQQNYGPAMQRLQGDLASRVEGSKALQEALFSTAVQHGPGGAAKIWNQNFREGVSDDELIQGIYATRVNKFGSSTPQVQESVRQRLADEQKLILAMRQGEISQPSVSAATSNAPAQPQPTAAAEDLNAQAAHPAILPQAMASTTQDHGTPKATPVIASPNPRPASIESVAEIAPPQTTGTNTMPTASIEKLLQGILAVLTQQSKANASSGDETPPHIRMDFDDPVTLRLAHDQTA